MKKKLCNATMWCPQNTLLAAFFLIVQCVVLLNWFLLDFLAILKHGSFAGHFAILIAITIELDVLWLRRRGYISALLVLTLLRKSYICNVTMWCPQNIQHLLDCATCCPTQPITFGDLGICKDRQGILKSETILLKALQICCFSFGSRHSTPQIKMKIGSKL